MVDMPRRHPRSMLVAKAGNEMTGATIKIIGDHDLSNVEYLQWLASEQQSTLKYMLREERHPDDPDKPADWE